MKKHLINLAAAVCGLSVFAATSIPLHNGANAINVAGEIVGVECMTVGASQAVTAAVEIAVTEYTNAYRAVTSRHTRYDFTITNYDGNAAIATNVLDRFSYADWMRGTTNLIISAVKPTATNITEQVADGKRAKATYTKSTAIGNGTASNHYLKLTPASTMHFFDGVIKLDCGEGDRATILVK